MYKEYSVVIFTRKKSRTDVHSITFIGNDRQDRFVSNTFPSTGGSHLSRTAVKPDSLLARIFAAKFLCIIKLIIIIG